MAFELTTSCDHQPLLGSTTTAKFQVKLGLVKVVKTGANRFFAFSAFLVRQVQLFYLSATSFSIRSTKNIFLQLLTVAKLSRSNIIRGFGELVVKRLTELALD